MAMNRIQFQHGMSLFEHFRHFGTEAQCVSALERLRRPDGFRCPSCGGAAHCVLHGSARKTFQRKKPGTKKPPAFRASGVVDALRLSLTIGAVG